MLVKNRRFNPHHRFNGSFIPEQLSKSKEVSPGAKLVWGRFYRYAGSTGGIFPSMATLADEIGLSVKQTRIYVHELKSVGLIEYVQIPGKVGNYYFLEGNVFNPKPEPPPEPLKIVDDTPLASESTPESDTPLASESTTPLASESTTPLASESTPLSHPRAEESQLRGSNEKRQLEPSIVSQPASEESLPEEPKLEIEHDDDIEITIDNISEWVQDVFHRQTGRAYSTIMGKDRAKFMALVEQNGPLALKAKIEAWIDGGGKTPADFLRQMPGAANSSMRNSAYRGSVVRERRSDESYSLPKRTTQPSASVPQIEAHTDRTRGLVLRWNQLVPARPTNFEGTRGYSIAMLEQMQMDAEFMQGFDCLCQKAQAIIQNKGVEASWLTFGWLFRPDKNTAEPNWGKLLRGELDMMAAKKQTAGQKQDEGTQRLLAKWRAKAEADKAGKA